jgi:two-component system response regulator YesN
MSGQSVVLVIDDDEVMRLILKDMLSRESCVVHEAADGREGLEKIKEINPEIVFCDRMMPNMSGFALRKHLEENMPEFRGEFVFLTSLTDERDKQAAADLDIAAYLDKPVSPEALRECLESLRQRGLRLRAG